MAKEIILGIDVETSGFVVGTDFITEVAYVIKEVGRVKPLKIFQSYVKTQDGVLSSEIQDITKITPDLLEVHGQSLVEVMTALVWDISAYDVDFMMAHNAPFDKGMLNHAMKTSGVLETDRLQRALDVPWICTQRDIEWPYKSSALYYVGAELGFLNPFPHDALSDVMSMFRCVGEAVRQGIVPSFDAIIGRSMTPTIEVSCNPGYERKDEAKALKFRWHPQSKTWRKQIKESELPLLRAQTEFEITVLEN